MNFPPIACSGLRGTRDRLDKISVDNSFNHFFVCSVSSYIHVHTLFGNPIMNTNGNAPSLTTKIVSEYVSHHKLAVSEIPNLITTVYQTIGHLGQANKEEETRTPAVSIRRSVQRDYVVCLDCGFRAVTLRRHVKVQHGVTPDEYLQRWGLKSNHPLTAPAYSERRSTMAKAFGLGRKPSMETTPVQVVAESPMPIAAESETKPAPKRRSRARPAAKPADLANDRPSTTMPPDRGRKRSRARVAAQQ